MRFSSPYFLAADVFLGDENCLRAFRVVHGVGCGRSRFDRARFSNPFFRLTLYTWKANEYFGASGATESRTADPLRPGGVMRVASTRFAGGCTGAVRHLPNPRIRPPFSRISFPVRRSR